jgi:hypothetical protein
MKTNHFQLIALALVALPMTACQTTSPNPPNRFDQADVNRDKSLSLDETNNLLVGEIFAARDANKDKQLSRAEVVEGNNAKEVKSFTERDANGDGNITMEEALAYGRKKGLAKQLMRDADTDKNGQLSSAEVEAYYGKREGPAR